MTYGEQIGSLRRTLHRALVHYVGERSKRPMRQLLALRSISLDQVHTQVQLAERLLIDAPAASRMLALLEGDGLVKRTAGEDRRCVRLHVTAAARAEIKVIDDGLRWLDGEIRKHVSKHEFEANMELMARLQEGMTR